MKILVAVKRAIDYNVKARPKADGSAVDLANVKMSMNPRRDRRRRGHSPAGSGQGRGNDRDSIGPKQCQETLRTAMAMGVDRGILVETEEDVQPLAVAKLIKAVVDREQPTLVLLGKQAIDDDSNQTGQMLAALLDWPQGTFACGVELANDKLSVRREIDGGIQTLELAVPAVITSDLRLNEPRYVKLPNIMKAKKKPLDTLTPAELGVDVAPRLSIVKVAEPPARRGVKCPTCKPWSTNCATKRR